MAAFSTLSVNNLLYCSSSSFRLSLVCFSYEGLLILFAYWSAISSGELIMFPPLSSGGTILAF